jgi:hypothetical protein
MSLSIQCAMCPNELDEFGAVVLSPPDQDSRCDKIHVCKDCYYLKIHRTIFDVVTHHHGNTNRSHIHAWGSIPHTHMVRAICHRPECVGYPTHNIHPQFARGSADPAPPSNPRTV